MCTFWSIPSWGSFFVAPAVTSLAIDSVLGLKDWIMSDTLSIISRNLKSGEEGHRCPWIIALPCDKCYDRGVPGIWGHLQEGPQPQKRHLTRTKGLMRAALGVGRRALLAKGRTFAKAQKGRELGEMATMLCDGVKGTWHEMRPGKWPVPGEEGATCHVKESALHLCWLTFYRLTGSEEDGSHVNDHF